MSLLNMIYSLISNYYFICLYLAKFLFNHLCIYSSEALYLRHHGFLFRRNCFDYTRYEKIFNYFPNLQFLFISLLILKSIMNSYLCLHYAVYFIIKYYKKPRQLIPLRLCSAFNLLFQNFQHLSWGNDKVSDGKLLPAQYLLVFIQNVRMVQWNNISRHHCSKYLPWR